MTACIQVRVSFTQRTAKLLDGQLFGAGGYDAFMPEPVGISMLEVSMTLPKIIYLAQRNLIGVA